MSRNQKKVWITGASSGIGKALAKKFATEGWKVAASARRKEILDEKIATSLSSKSLVMISTTASTACGTRNIKLTLI